MNAEENLLNKKLLNDIQSLAVEGTGLQWYYVLSLNKSDIKKLKIIKNLQNYKKY